jgi:hypothetical protein
MVAVADKKGNTDIDTNSIKNILKETLEDKQMNGFFKVEAAPEALYETSKAEGISLNKLILAQQAERQGIKLDFKTNPSESVLQVLEKAGIQKEHFFVPVSGRETKESGNGNGPNGKQMTNPEKPETEKAAREAAQSDSLQGEANQRTNGLTGGSAGAGTNAETHTGTSAAGSGNQNGPAAGGTQTIPQGNVPAGGIPQTTGSGTGTGTTGGTGQTDPSKEMPLPGDKDQDQTDSDQDKDDEEEDQDEDEDQLKQPATNTNPSGSPTGAQPSMEPSTEPSTESKETSTEPSAETDNTSSDSNNDSSDSDSDSDSDSNSN